MAYELADAYISLVPSFKGGTRALSQSLSGPINQAGPQAGRSLGSSILRGIGKGIAIGGGIVAALGLRNLGREVAAAASGIQNTTATLSGLLGSADAATDTMRRLREVARNSPIDYQTYLAAGESLAYLGVSGDQAEGVLRNVGAAITAAGGSSQQMESVSDALLKMVNSGRVYAEDLNRISDAGVPIFSGLAAHFGTNIENVREMVQSGQVGIEDVLATIQNAEGDTFQAMLVASENATQTFSNQWAIAKDNITVALAQGIMPALEALTPVMQAFASRGPALVESGISAITSAFSTGMGRIGEWRGQIEEFFQSAQGRDLKTDTIEKLQGIWDKLATAWTKAWPSIQSIAGSLAQASASVGISTWQLLLVVLDQIADVLNVVLVPILDALARWMKENPTLVAIVVGAYGAWRVAQLALNAAMRANPIVLIVSLIAGLIAWLVTAYQTNEKFREIVQKVWSAIQGAISFAWNNVIKPVIDALVGAFMWVWDTAGTVRDGVVAAWNWIKDKIKEAIEQAMNGPLGAIINAFQWVWDKAVQVRDGISAAWTWVKTKLSELGEQIMNGPVGRIIEGFQKIWDKAIEVRDGIKGAWETVAGVIGEAFDNIWEGIKTGLNTVFGFINRWMISPLNKVLEPFLGANAIPNLPKLHSGGMVPGTGEKPYMLLGGEAVLNPAATKMLGPDVISALNNGEGFGGGWPKWLDWDTVKQALAIGAEHGTGTTQVIGSAGVGLLKGIEKIVEAGMDLIAPMKSNRPQFAWGPAVGTSEKLGNAVIDWARIGHDAVVKQVGDLNGGVPDLSGGTSFVLPRGSYRVGVPIGGYPGHTGQDFPAPVGTPVFAPFAGQFSGVNLGNRSYGRYANVVAGGLRFIGAHLSALVGGNRFVQAGEMIGRVGSTGNSTGPHLHAEFRQGGRVQNPRKYLKFDTGYGVLDPGWNLMYNGTGGPEPLIDPRRHGSDSKVLIQTFGTPQALVSDVMFSLQAQQNEQMTVGV